MKNFKSKSKYLNLGLDQNLKFRIFRIQTQIQIFRVGFRIFQIRKILNPNPKIRKSRFFSGSDPYKTYKFFSEVLKFYYSASIVIIPLPLELPLSRYHNGRQRLQSNGTGVVTVTVLYFLFDKSLHKKKSWIKIKIKFEF